jgi:hypothetical protein
MKKSGCKPGQKVSVVITEFGGNIDDVRVICDYPKARGIVDKYIKKHFGSKKEFEQIHGQTDKEDIYLFTPKAEE